MTTRGRPRHPDILTPRQWEVLDFVRQGLTNEEIAERLVITLDGAKFHVSEIIRKLGVDSRYEAAAWQPAPPSRTERFRVPALAPFAALRRLHWNAFTYTVGAAATVGVVAATALLAWGVTRTRGDGATGPLAAPPAASPTTSALTGIPPL